MRIVFERRQTHRKKGSDDFIMVRVRELDQHYPCPTKRASILKSRREQGLLVPDEDFPKDENEAWIWVKKGASMKLQNVVDESMTAKGDMQVTAATADALLGEGGILASGATPALQGMSAKGEESISKALGGGGTPAKKTAAVKEGKNSAQKLEADSPKERALAAMKEMMAEAAEGRRLLTLVEPYGISPDVFKEIREFTKELDVNQRKTHKLVLADCDSDARYEKYTGIMKTKRAWWNARKETAKSIEKIVMPAKKKQKKGEAAAAEPAAATAPDAGGS